VFDLRLENELVDKPVLLLANNYRGVEAEFMILRGVLTYFLGRRLRAPPLLFVTLYWKEVAF